MRERMVKHLSHLHQFIVTHYDVEELRTLCFDLGVRYDDLGGEGLSAKARELILQIGRRGQIDALLIALRKDRFEMFAQAGLPTDSSDIKSLYAGLPTFEASFGTARVGPWSRAWAFAGHHWLVLLGILVTDSVLILLYHCLRNRYLIGSSTGIGMVALATLAISGWYTLSNQHWQSAWLWVTTLVASLLLIGGLAWQVKQLFQPPQFPTQAFGIAVARLGEGESFRVTSLSRDVTDQVVRGLEDTVRGNPIWDEVGVMPVGLVTDEDQAREWGNRVRADLVIWGQVIVVGEGNVSVHFEIIQTLDRASSPAFPLVLPAQTRFAQTGTDTLETPLRPREIKKLVSQQCEVITAFSLGLAAYFDRDYASAIQQFQTVVKVLESEALSGSSSQDDMRGLTYFYLGRSYQQLGELNVGEDWLWQAAKYRPEDPAARLSIAYGYNSMGNRDETRRLAQEVLELATDWLQLHPDSVEVAYDRGLAYGLLDEPERAADEFEAILEQEPTFYIAYISAGLAYLEVGNIEQAVEHFQAAIQQGERSEADISWGCLYLAEAYDAAGESEKAETLYQRAVELSPDVDWMHFLQGRFYESQGWIDSAQQSYETMVEVTYDKAWAHAEMAKFFRRQSQLEEAIEEFKTVRRERVFDTLSQVFLAELYLETNQVELARNTFEEALTQTPDLAYGHASYGKALVQMGDYELAISHLQEAVALDPSDGVTHFNLGQAYEANGQPAEALETYKTILNAPLGLHSAEARQRAQERANVLLFPTATPTLTPAATLQPPSTATPKATDTSTTAPVPTVVQPELVEPPYGREYQNPITFKWSGSLGAGQLYQVTAYHPDSDHTVHSELLTIQSWTVYLPAERYGEWRWWVTIVTDRGITATSPEWMFWFNPFPREKEEPTPYLPSPSTPTSTSRPDPTRTPSP